MAFQVFIPNVQAVPAQRAFGRIKDALEFQEKLMAANRIIFRKASGGETYAPSSLNPEKHEVPSMSAKICEDL
ncbi:hypothetical protein [Ochrobactrum vermis]|uniref:hypothetical protein n=1 Tax=Ochrobactrum vermis TaxID=1827297 RepID=UPI0015E42394|nr:hypothetical protein [Ochrobactrum vermis]